MKLKALTAAFSAAILTVSAGAFTAFAADVEINDVNFPDDIFRAYVSENCDSNGDEVLSESEIDAVDDISVSRKNISNLKGIEYFTNLTYLDCSSNQLTSLDVSSNTALEKLWCSTNKLTEIKLNKKPALWEMWCNDNQLTNLDISGCSALEKLYCSDNQLEVLNVSQNSALEELSCFYNQLTKLDVRSNSELSYLTCVGNQLTELDVSQNTKLTALLCSANPLKSLDVSHNLGLYDLFCVDNQLTSLDVRNNTFLTALNFTTNQITDIDVSQNTSLKSLCCGSNQLKKLDVSNNTDLVRLECYSNQLTSLNVKSNTALEALECYENQLTSLDVRSNTALETLVCYSNQLKRLDVSKNSALRELFCKSNSLISLDVSRNTDLKKLFCDYNKLTSLDLSKNNALKDLSLYGSCYSIGTVTTFDLSTLPGKFDISKASDWQGATCENGVLTNFTSDTVTYTYDCGNGKKGIFTLKLSEKADDTGDAAEPVPAFVERLYTTLLSRPSEEAGKSEWVDAVNNGTTAAEAASGFVLSEELRNQNLSNGEFVDRMYRTFLDREADAAGKADWVSILDNGCSYAYILNSFAGSQEFNNLCDSYGITAGSYESSEPRDKNADLTAFVSRMYTKALNRAYDVNGLNDWTGDYLDGKATANDIAYGFILSEEFEGRNLSDEAYVDTLYRTFFDREPDEGGKAGWLDELANGTSRKDVLDGFLGAEEFANLKKSFGV